MPQTAEMYVCNTILPKIQVEIISEMLKTPSLNFTVQKQHFERASFAVGRSLPKPAKSSTVTTERFGVPILTAKQADSQTYPFVVLVIESYFGEIRFNFF